MRSLQYVTPVCRRAGLVLLTASLLALVVLPASAHQNNPRPAPDAGRRNVTAIEFIGEATFPTGYQFEGTEVGGLSAISYDSGKGVYYALSDDRSQIDPARFYSLTIDLSDGTLDQGDVVFTGATTLLDQDGSPFPELSLDPEGLTLTDDGHLYISSEGDATALVAPFVNEFTRDGQQIAGLPVDTKFLPTADQSSGIRNNLAFESLTLTPSGRFLYTATENALFQDGPAADLGQQSLSRILKYDLASGQEIGEFVYEVGPVPDAPVPADAFRTNGLVELLALDNNGTLLALERAFSVGKGNSVKLYEVLSQGALDVIDELSLFREEEDEPFEIDPVVSKRLLLDLGELAITLDNLEGMTLGPRLPDGRQSLILVSDSNFSDTQFTQFLAFAIDLETTPAALPTAETPQAVNEDGADSPLQGDSDDPAIWVHPTRPEDSLVIATLKEGGLVVFDLAGRVLQTIAPASFGEIRYNNVDLIYNFLRSGKRVDLAVVSDRINDTLAIFMVDPRSRTLVDVTSAGIPDTIFGVDDGEATAYGLATYTSIVDGRHYAYVTQTDGNLVAQLQLFDDGNGGVNAETVRTIELPAPTGDPEDSQAEGMVVDRELGVLYVGMEDEVGVLKLGAEPDAGDSYEVVLSVEDAEPDLEGLTIYYGKDGAGYLLASSQGDSRYVLLERTGDNAEVGRLVIGDNLRKGIDQANESDGADVINVFLGPRFPKGLLVVQDGANDPQAAVQDDEELENASTNFKFVPWDGVAKAFPDELVVDTQSYDPRGDFPTRINRMTSDIRALVYEGGLAAKDAAFLVYKLKRAAQQYGKANYRAAIRQLKGVERRLILLIRKNKLDAAIGANLLLAVQSASNAADFKQSDLIPKANEVPSRQGSFSHR